MPANHVNAVWTDEQSAVLTENLTAGLSMAENAAEINEKFNTHYSRNAVCGRAYRIGLVSPEKPKPAPQPRKPQPYKPRPKPTFNTETIRLQCAEIVPGNVSLVDLSGCRWPVNDISPFLFCNHTQLEGSSYCHGHFLLSIGPGSYSERRANQMVTS